MNQDNDNRMVYILLLFMAIEFTAFPAITVSTWYLLLIFAEIIIFLVVYVKIQIASLKYGTGKKWWLTRFHYPGKKPDFEEYPLSLDGKPKLTRCSYGQMRALLDNPQLAEHHDKFKAHVDRYSNADVRYDPTVIDPTGNVMGYRVVDKNKIDFSDYKIENFLEPSLRAFLPNWRIYWFIHRYLEMGYVLNKKRVRGAFLRLGDEQLMHLQRQIKEKYHKYLDMREIQMCLSHDYENFFYKKEIVFLRSKNIRTMQDLLDADLERLEVEMNKNLCKQRLIEKNIPLAKIARDLQKEIIDEGALFLERVSDKTYDLLMDIREMHMMKIFFKYLPYSVTFHQTIEATVENEGFRVEFKRKTVWVLFPDLAENSLLYAPDVLCINGFPTTCPDVEHVQLLYMRILQNSRPVYLLNDCGYLRKNDRNSIVRDGDRCSYEIIGLLQKELDTKDAENEDISTLYNRANTTIGVKSETIRNMEGFVLDEEEPENKVPKLAKRYKPRGTPKDKEVPIFWFLLIVVLVAGIFIGMKLGDFW